MPERRISTRHKSFLQGRIFYNRRRSSIDCLVRDISEHGARLVFSEAVVIPDVVELHIPNKAEIHRARVQWRTGDEVGVAFGLDDESPSIVPAATPADILARLHKLEGDVLVLQRKVNELQNELKMRQGSDL